jgi:hypothetical protein
VGLPVGHRPAGALCTDVDATSPTDAWAVGFFGPTPLQALAFHFK